MVSLHHAGNISDGFSIREDNIVAENVDIDAASLVKDERKQQHSQLICYGTVPTTVLSTYHVRVFSTILRQYSAFIYGNT